MKLVLFELKKLFSGKIKWILIAFVFLNFIIYYVSIIPFMPTKKEQELRKEWSQMVEESGGSMEEKLEKLQQETSNFSSLSLYFYDRQFWEEWEEQKKQDVIDKYKGTKYWEEETIMASLNVLSQLSSEYQAVFDYQSFINGMQERADQMVTVPIFAKKGSFGNRNIQKTANDFKQMKDIEIEPLDGSGVEAFQRFYLTDFFMIALIVFLCFQQFGEDNRTGMSHLIQATPNGKGKLRFAQMCAIWIAVIGSAIVLYGGNLLLTIRSFPLEEAFSKYIQGVTSFRNLPIPLTVCQYLILYLLGKLAAVFFITVVLELIAVRFNGGSLSWILFGICISSSFFLWFFLPDSPITKIFQYLNLVGIMDTKQILGNYQNLNLFSYPVSLLIAAIGFVSVLSLIAIGLTMTIRKTEWKLWKIERTTDTKRRIWKSIVSYEQYKIFWKQKIWLITIALVVIAISGLQKKETLISTEEFFYNQYVQEIEGVYTEEKSQLVQALESDLEITNMEQKKAIEALRNQTQNLQVQLEKCDDSEKNQIAFLNEKKFEKFFYNTELEMKNTIIIMIALLFSLHSLFYQDKKTNMYTLLHTMPQGNLVYWSKIKIGAVLGAVYTIILWSSAYAQYWIRYGISDTDFLIQSLSKFGSMPLSCSILEYMILTIIIRLIIGIYIGVVFAVLAELFANPTQTVIVGAVMFVLPICFSMIENMGYQNPLVEFIHGRLAFLTKPFYFVTSLQWNWYQNSSWLLILFCMLPFWAVISGYHIWKCHRI